MKSQKSNIDYSMILIVLGFVVVVVGFFLRSPNQSKVIIDRANGYILNNLGFVYVWTVLISLFLCVYVGVGKYGSIRLGEEKKEYSEFEWAAMMFCSSMAAGFMYWGTIEWVFHYIKPSFGILPFSVEAAEYAATAPLYYWGISAWGVYLIPAVAFAFLRYNLKKERFDVSIACEPILGKYSNKFVGKIINVFFLFGILGGIGTALGIGSPLVSASLDYLFGWKDTPALRFWVIVVVTVIFTTSAYNGIKKGIRVLSNGNIVMMLLMILFVFLVGNKNFIVRMQATSFGILLDQFFQMSTYLDPINQGGDPESWLVFYWAWWLSYSIFMGLFIARISRGRTIRQVIFGGLLYGFAGSFFMFSVLGNYSMDMHLRGIYDMVQGLTNNGGPATVVQLFGRMPFGTIFIATLLITSLLSMATSFDSAAYTMAMVSSKELDVSGSPNKGLIIFWALTLAALPMVIMAFNGSLVHVQAMSVILALPTTVVYIMIVVSFFKMMAEHQKNSVP